MSVESAPHPMAMCLAVIPLPMHDQKAEGEDPVESRQKVAVGGIVLEMLEIDARKALLAQPGIHAGLVMECGPLAEGMDAEIVRPFYEQCVVYFPEGCGTRIGEYLFLHFQNVIAWTDPPATNPSETRG